MPALGQESLIKDDEGIDAFLLTAHQPTESHLDIIEATNG